MSIEEQIRASVESDEEAKRIRHVIDRGEGSLVSNGRSSMSWRRFPGRIHIMHYAGEMRDFRDLCAHLVREVQRDGIGDITWDGRSEWSAVAERMRRYG